MPISRRERKRKQLIELLNGLRNSKKKEDGEVEDNKGSFDMSKIESENFEAKLSYDSFRKL